MTEAHEPPASRARAVVTPTQALVLMRLHHLGRGRMTRFHGGIDPRTERVLVERGWLRRDGEKIGLTEQGWQMMAAHRAGTCRLQVK